MDLHISVIADFKTACPDVEVVDWCLSGHAWVMKRTQDFPDHINPNTWQNLTPESIRRFQAKYDPFLSTFDGFVVGFCSAFAMIYEKYNKPIVMLNAVRYDIPFCWTKDMGMLAQWKACLHRLQAKNLLTLVSNNKADQLYLRLGTGLSSRFIPSLCLYTNTQYNPTRPTFLCYGGTFPTHPLLTLKKDLPHPHQWSDVTSFRGVINYPYEVSLMSCFEHFTAGCPLFFPSKAYWKTAPGIQSLSAYWDKDLPAEFAPLSTPQDWIELADMYETFQSPNTYYFDSTEHLFHLLETFEYVEDREFRQAHIQRVKEEWKQTMAPLLARPQVRRPRVPALVNGIYRLHSAV